jgi:hypothetical protein
MRLQGCAGRDASIPPTKTRAAQNLLTNQIDVGSTPNDADNEILIVAIHFLMDWEHASFGVA